MCRSRWFRILFSGRQIVFPMCLGRGILVIRSRDAGMAADRPEYRGGFTLVELLVVIGIISLLIAFLLPALDKAQQAAKATVCESNMREVGVALLNYADDHNGWMFPPDMGY